MAHFISHELLNGAWWTDKLVRLPLCIFFVIVVCNAFCFKKVNNSLLFPFIPVVPAILYGKSTLLLKIQKYRSQTMSTQMKDLSLHSWKPNYVFISCLAAITLQNPRWALETKNRLTVSSSFYLPCCPSHLRKRNPFPSWMGLWGAMTKESAIIFLPAGSLSKGFLAHLLLLIQCLCWVRMTGSYTINLCHAMSRERSSSEEHLHDLTLKNGLTWPFRKACWLHNFTKAQLLIYSWGWEMQF